MEEYLSLLNIFLVIMFKNLKLQNKCFLKGPDDLEYFLIFCIYFLADSDSNMSDVWPTSTEQTQGNKSPQKRQKGMFTRKTWGTKEQMETREVNRKKVTLSRQRAALSRERTYLEKKIQIGRDL